MDHQSRFEGAGEGSTEGRGIRLAGEREFEPALVIIVFMDGDGHRQSSSEGSGALPALIARIRRWATELGFAAVRIGDARLPGAERDLEAWLASGSHGEMDYMSRHGSLRCRPDLLMPGCRSVISARMNYLAAARPANEVLAEPSLAFVSRYALGRDYHKVLRQRLKRLALRIAEDQPHQWRVVVDSAPLMEVAVGQRSGLGWRGKHTLLLDRDAGSGFFLGEILTDLALPPDPPISDHCGQCTACIDACPTRAIVAPYRVDARRCISYLTIELRGAIPESLRPLVGNRIYGCDDCQIVCPWNRFAQLSTEPDFRVRHDLDTAALVELFAWSAADFDERMAGSAIYRIGYDLWLRNIAVALGNGPATPEAMSALRGRSANASALVREHVAWALMCLEARVQSETNSDDDHENVLDLKGPKQHD